MSKKTIIIILLVAFAAFVAWKMGLFARTGIAIQTNPSDNNGDMTTDGIIEGTSMNVQEKQKCRGWVKEILRALKAGDWSNQTIVDRAESNGISYNQQIVCEAVWQMYETSKLFGKEYAQKVIEEIKSM